jgi:CubicO group peptidase (beta-lactamase class C family)
MVNMKTTIALFFLCCYNIALSQVDTAHTTKIATYLAARNKATPLNAAVLVRAGGKDVVKRYFGLSNARAGEPIGDQTLFLIASCSKPITATAIMLLAQQGRLSLNDDVSKWLNGVPAAWKGITVKHLLSHTSGIPDYLTLKGGASLAPGLNNILQLYQKSGAAPRRPGAYQYSNANFVLLSYVIEKCSGSSYEAFMQQQLFEPLQMRNTGFAYKYKGALLAQSYSNVFRMDSMQLGEKADLGVLKGAGGIYSTPADLCLFLNGLKRILSAASIDTMLKPVSADYALGWHVQTQFNKVTARHSGGINGFAAEMRFVPADSLSIVLLSNVRFNDMNLRYAAFDMLKILNGEGPGGEVDINPDYLGKYSVPKEFVARFRSDVLEIRNDDGVMQLALPGGTTRMLMPVSKGRFFFYGEAVDAEFTEMGRHLRITSPSLGQIDCYKVK